MSVSSPSVDSPGYEVVSVSVPLHEEECIDLTQEVPTACPTNSTTSASSTPTTPPRRGIRFSPRALRQLPPLRTGRASSPPIRELSPDLDDASLPGSGAQAAGSREREQQALRQTLRMYIRNSVECELQNVPRSRIRNSEISLPRPGVPSYKLSICQGIADVEWLDDSDIADSFRTLAIVDEQIQSFAWMVKMFHSPICAARPSAELDRE